MMVGSSRMKPQSSFGALLCRQCIAEPRVFWHGVRSGGCLWKNRNIGKILKEKI